MEWALFCITAYLIALIAYYIRRDAIFSHLFLIFILLLPIQPRVELFCHKILSMGSSAFFLKYANNKFIVCILSINAIRKVEVCWIVYKIPRIVRQSQICQKTKQHFWNSRIKKKTVLGNIVRMMCTKYRFNQKTRIMLNNVPKFARCEETSKKFLQVQTDFQSRKPKQKISKFQN